MHSSPPKPIAFREALIVFACFAFVVWLAHFFYFRRIGFYEDDYLYTLGCFDWGWAKAWDELVRAFTQPVQGRPLNHAFRRMLNFITLRGDTWAFGQLASLLLLCLNATLLFQLARKHTGKIAAFAAGLVYLLYPADTSRQILMHQSDLLLGATLCLLGLLSFSSGRRVLGWFFGLCTLLNYEAFFLPLLLAPLLSTQVPGNRPTRAWWRSLLVHGLCFCGVAAAVLGVRALLGEQRAVELGGGGLWEAPLKSFQAILQGPFVSFSAFWSAPAATLPLASGLHWLLALLAATPVVLLARWLLQGAQSADKAQGRLLLFALAGLGMWAIGYALCIRPDNFPPTTLVGRLTGVHVAPSLGFALLAAAGIEAVRRKLGTLAIQSLVLPAAFFVFTALFALRGLSIQKDEYVVHWEMQGRFWHQVMPLVSDLREGEPVLLETDTDKSAFPSTPGFPLYGIVNYTPVVLHRVGSYPSGWKKAPRLFALWGDYPYEDRAGGVRLLKTPAWMWEGLWPEVKDGAFVYLRSKEGRLERVSGPVSIRGRVFNARPQELGVTNLSPNRRFHALWP